MTPRIVLALAPPDALRRVQLAAPRDTVVRVTTLAQMSADLRGAVGGVVFADTTGWHDEALARMADSVAAHGARLILHAELNPRLARQLTAIGDETIPELILKNTDDSVTRIRAAIERQLASVPALVLHTVRRQMAVLDPRAAPRTLEMFAWGRLPVQSGSLAQAANVTEKTLLSWYSQAGFATAVAVSRGAMTARAYELMANGHTLADAAFDSGFGTVSHLRNTCNALLGFPPTRAQKLLSASAAAALIVKHIRR